MSRKTLLTDAPTRLLLCVSLLLLLSATLCASPFQADFTSDGIVGLDDFVLFAGAFGTTSVSPDFDDRFDLEADGSVGFGDFVLFVLEFGQTVDCGNDLGNGGEIIDGPDGPAGPDHDNAFRALTVHPSDAFTLLIGTERNGFVRTTDGGQTWTRHRHGLRHFNGGYAEIWDIAYAPSDPSVVYAATLDSPGPVVGDFPSAIGGVYRSADGGDTWQRRNCGLENSRVTSVQVHPENPNIVVIGIEGGEPSFTQLAGQFFDGGIFRSDNGGACWTRADLGENDRLNGYIWMRRIEDGFLTFGSVFNDPERNVGFYRGSLDGASWTSFAPEHTEKSIGSFDVSHDGRVIYAHERNSFRMLISQDAGVSWFTTEINQTNGPVAVSPADPQIVVYGSTANLYRSFDGVQTVALVHTADNTVTDIVFSPSAPDTVFAIAEGFSLYRSIDAGASFELLANLRTDVLSP